MKIDRGQIQFRDYVSTGTEPKPMYMYVLLVLFIIVEYEYESILKTTLLI